MNIWLLAEISSKLKYKLEGEGNSILIRNNSVGKRLLTERSKEN